MVAVISDIHGNLTALNSVLDHIDSSETIICCGDIVGYGSKPRECLIKIKEEADYVMNFAHIMRITVTARVSS